METTKYSSGAPQITSEIRHLSVEFDLLSGKPELELIEHLEHRLPRVETDLLRYFRSIESTNDEEFDIPILLEPELRNLRERIWKKRSSALANVRGIGAISDCHKMPCNFYTFTSPQANKHTVHLIDLGKDRSTITVQMCMSRLFCTEDKKLLVNDPVFLRGFIFHAWINTRRHGSGIDEGEIGLRDIKHSFQPLHQAIISQESGHFSDLQVTFAIAEDWRTVIPEPYQEYQITIGYSNRQTVALNQGTPYEGSGPMNVLPNIIFEGRFYFYENELLPDHLDKVTQITPSND